MALAEGARYLFYFPTLTEAELSRRVAELMARPEILVKRTVKRRQGRNKRRIKEEVLTDIRPMLSEVVLLQNSTTPKLAVTMTPHEGKRCRAKDVVGLLSDEAIHVRAVKQECLTQHEGHWLALEAYLASKEAQTDATETDSRL